MFKIKKNCFLKMKNCNDARNLLFWNEKSRYLIIIIGYRLLSKSFKLPEGLIITYGCDSHSSELNVICWKKKVLLIKNESLRYILNIIITKLHVSNLFTNITHDIILLQLLTYLIFNVISICDPYYQTCSVYQWTIIMHK